MDVIRTLLAGAAVSVAMATAQGVSAGQDVTTDTQSIERGRYLVRISGCNDCHTPGYAQSGGGVPEQDWLTGDRLGWHGPWGTTFPGNLRLFMAGISEDQWVGIAHSAQYRPPMPWFALRDMSADDIRAIYRFVKHLGPAGQPAPAYLPPDQTPIGPVVMFPSPVK